MNIHGTKFKKTMASVIVIILVITMVVTMIAAFI